MMKMSKHPEQWPEQKLVDNIPGRSRIESGRCQLKSTHGQGEVTCQFFCLCTECIKLKSTPLLAVMMLHELL